MKFQKSAWLSLILIALFALAFAADEQKPEGERLRDYLDNPEKTMNWKKTIPKGWNMQQNICLNRIKNHLKVYGEGIKAATPEEAIAKPKKPRKLLMLQMFWHDDTSGMQGTFQEGLKQMADQPGAFEMKVISSLVEITREELFSFDAVLINGCSYSLAAAFIDPEKRYSDPNTKAAVRYYFMFERTEEFREHGKEMRQALLEYVKSGKGLIAVGAAPCSAWPEYQEMFGSTDQTGSYGPVFGHKHPESLEDDPTVVQSEQKDNPLCAMFPQDKPLTIHTGVFLPRKMFFEKSGNTVLLSIDIPKTAEKLDEKMSKRIGNVAKSGGWTDQAPCTWIRKYGDGRVFCGVFECSGLFMTSPEIQKHLLAGIQYVMGDIDI